MNKFAKGNLRVDGNTVNVSMPFAKVDKAQRLVSGWATLDNIDTQGDVVLAEASAKAFARARGNIREMHQPIAVGKMVDFRADEYFDNGQLYQGIYVTAHVSEGAEDTWKKVLDGTLTGFSIGGEINDASNEFVKDAGRTVRFIKDYDLVELSLVDNPANQLANVLSLQKSATGSVTVTMGEVIDTVVENVFICTADDTVVIKSTDSETCPTCGAGMQNAGWLESTGDRAEKVQSIVSKFYNSGAKEEAPVLSEGGVEMGKEDNKENEAVVESTDESTNEEVNTSETADENATVDEAELTDETEVSPEEVVDDETEISKKIDDLHAAVKASLTDSKNETIAKVVELEDKIDSVKTEFLSKASELEQKINEFGTKVEAQKARLSQLENNLEKWNRAGAVQKSAEIESAEPVVQKETFWGGAFSVR